MTDEERVEEAFKAEQRKKRDAAQERYEEASLRGLKFYAIFCFVIFLGMLVSMGAALRPEKKNSIRKSSAGDDPCTAISSWPQNWYSQMIPAVTTGTPYREYNLPPSWGIDIRDVSDTDYRAWLASVERNGFVRSRDSASSGNLREDAYENDYVFFSTQYETDSENLHILVTKKDAY